MIKWIKSVWERIRFGSRIMVDDARLFYPGFIVVCGNVAGFITKIDYYNNIVWLKKIHWWKA